MGRGALRAVHAQVARGLVHLRLRQVERRDLDEGIDHARAFRPGLEPVPGMRAPAGVAERRVGSHAFVFLPFPIDSAPPHRVRARRKRRLLVEELGLRPSLASDFSYRGGGFPLFCGGGVVSLAGGGPLGLVLDGGGGGFCSGAPPGCELGALGGGGACSLDGGGAFGVVVSLGGALAEPPPGVFELPPPPHAAAESESATTDSNNKLRFMGITSERKSPNGGAVSQAAFHLRPRALRLSL